MTRRLLRTWASAAMALGALAWSAPGMAHDDDATRSPVCQLRTLRGLYVFAADGFTIPANVALPKAIVEFIGFNGDGTLTSPGGATRSINGAIGQFPGGGVGTYTLGNDCRGSLSFVGGPNFDIFVSPQGDELWMIQTDAGNVLQGKVSRVWPDRGR
ncbi:hypothetical protein [Variovorax sp. GT1P44]|uniref:hypothetical protein n=1 Tax=Variovorax sp. GT1P44 TaxID=3443742 RepID=UPI003F481A49